MPLQRPGRRMTDHPIEIVGGVGALRHEHGPLFAVIGVFDGIHLGHRYLLRRLVDEARSRGARPSVITFDSHPDEILVGAAPPLLLDPAERLRMLGGLGVDVVVVQHFDAALRATEYDAFVRLITARTRLSGLLMTPDAAFGHDRRGTPDAVRALGELDGFDLVVVPPFALDGRSVRSSDVRSAIATGDLETAARLLGRPYSIAGEMGGDGALRFAMPVAHPPEGAYRVSLNRPDSGEAIDGDRRPARLTIDGPGTMRLDSPAPTDIGSRLCLEFETV
jgi:riboflavin kinase/FMN adenylyltransferase